MDSIRLAVPSRGDIEFVARNMRAADRAEIMASSELEPLPCLIRSVKVSSEVLVALTSGGVPFAIFGVAPVAEGLASPWMLGTDEMLRHGKEIVKLSRTFVKRWASAHGVLSNFVDTRNTTSIAWLKRTGFRMGEPEPFGSRGQFFRRFEGASNDFETRHIRGNK